METNKKILHTVITIPRNCSWQDFEKAAKLKLFTNVYSLYH